MGNCAFIACHVQIYIQGKIIAVCVVRRRLVGMMMLATTEICLDVCLEMSEHLLCNMGLCAVSEMGKREGLRWVGYIVCTRCFAIKL